MMIHRGNSIGGGMERIRGSRCVLFLLLALISISWTSASAQASQTPKVSGVNMLRPGAGDGPTEVSVAMWLVDIDSINSSNQNFVANVFVALHWKDERLAHSKDVYENYSVDQVWTPGVQIANEIGIVRRTFPESVDVAPDGTVKYMQRFVGPFSQPLRLEDFPFGTQTFRLQLVSPGNYSDEVKFVRNKSWIDDGVPKAGGISHNISLPDWNIESYNTLSEPYVVSPQIENAGYVFEFVARRDVRHYIWKVLLPLLFIVMMSWAVFWIDPSNSGTQIAVAMTSMLTLIAYRFAIDTQVPKVPYMTRLDQFMVVGTVLVFLCLTQVIITSRLYQSGRKELSRKVDRLSRILFPILFITGLSLALLN